MLKRKCILCTTGYKGVIFPFEMIGIGTRRNKHTWKCKYCILIGNTVFQPWWWRQYILQNITLHNPEDHNTSLHYHENLNLIVNLFFEKDKFIDAQLLLTKILKNWFYTSQHHNTRNFSEHYHWVHIQCFLKNLYTLHNSILRSQLLIFHS